MAEAWAETDIRQEPRDLLVQQQAPYWLKTALILQKPTLIFQWALLTVGVRPEEVAILQGPQQQMELLGEAVECPAEVVGQYIEWTPRMALCLVTAVKPLDLVVTALMARLQVVEQAAVLEVVQEQRVFMVQAVAALAA